MPLKIRVKPEGKIFAGGTVIKNAGRHPADLVILSDTPVLRDDYLVNMDRSDSSDAANIYFLLQVVYLYKGKGKPLDTLVLETIKKFSVLYPHYADLVTELVAYLDAGDVFKALRLAHGLLEKEGGESVPELPH